MTAARKTPAQLMATKFVLTPLETAEVLGLTFEKGAKRGLPKRALVSELVAAGLLRPVNAARPPASQRFSVAEVRRYLTGAKTVTAHGVALRSVAS